MAFQCNICFKKNVSLLARWFGPRYCSDCETMLILFRGDITKARQYALYERKHKLQELK